MKQKLLTSLLMGMIALGSTGCVKKMLLNGQIHSTRIGSGAADTIGDYELARSASQASLMSFEGMHRLAPDNEDALYLLMRGWAGYAYAFPSDDYEVANLANNETEAEYHKKRAKLAFDRSISYGLELLSKRDEGFPAAKKNADTIKAWLKDKFTEPEDGENLFWVGAAWLARVNLLKDEPEYVADLFVGVAMLERSRELKPEFMSWGATATLGAYHARTPMAELDLAKQMLDEALSHTQHKALGVLVSYARYACTKGDQALYEKLLNEAVTADDPDPNLRLQNTIAKRRAKRGLSKQAMEDCGFSTSSPTPPTPPAGSSQPKAAAPATPAAPAAAASGSTSAKPATPPAPPAPSAKPAAPPAKPADGGAAPAAPPKP